jgi:hypothetical protein
LLRGNKKSSHFGPIGQLKPLEDALLRYVFEQRKRGINVESFDLVVKASTMCPVFNAKTFVAKISAVKRFTLANSLVYRMGTHESQRRPEDVAREAADFMSLMHPILEGPHRDRRYVLNMDQTPVYFLMSKKRTLDIVGKKTVYIRTSTNDTKRATVAVTIAADGTLLPSTVIFKGKRDGRIAKTELKTFSTIHFYKCQDNAWMDEHVMLSWVDDVLRPYVESAPENIIPLLILDSYRCHMMPSVVMRIEELGVEVRHIPGGCTADAPHSVSPLMWALISLSRIIFAGSGLRG